MKFPALLSLLLIPVFLSAQWVSFDLKNIETENFKSNVEPFIKSVSIASVNHFEDQYNINKRFRLGFSYSQSIDVSGSVISSELMGGYPNFGASLTVSDNLKLKGNYGIFHSGEDVAQSFAYGAGLKITNNEKKYWRMSLLFSELKGPNDLSLKTMDSNINYNFKFHELPLFAGIGSNSYKTKILIDNNELPNSVKGSTYYFLCGIQWTKEYFTATPIVQISSDVIVFSIEISGIMN